ncbi:antibiotic biosynthesis monooxygenase family protein [Paenibacillus sp. strain BS8-2]
MILEVAMLQVRPGMANEFEHNFMLASRIISKMKGYLKHELQRCLEDKNKYILLVQWETLEDHTIGFRESEEYKEWKQLLHHFYDPFPTVEHFEMIGFTEKSTVIETTIKRNLPNH